MTFSSGKKLELVELTTTDKEPSIMSGLSNWFNNPIYFSDEINEFLLKKSSTTLLNDFPIRHSSKNTDDYQPLPPPASASVDQTNGGENDNVQLQLATGRFSFLSAELYL